ncbi:hypothetical protein HanRHA438_Chr11g0520441 [Helianthus annuus]|nr:hypothetical protein HanRHA438_Chr11g0520441 [Helianthus annuus]
MKVRRNEHNCFQNRNLIIYLFFCKKGNLERTTILERCLVYGIVRFQLDMFSFLVNSFSCMALWRICSVVCMGEV